MQSSLDSPPTPFLLPLVESCLPLEFTNQECLSVLVKVLTSSHALTCALASHNSKNGTVQVTQCKNSVLSLESKIVMPPITQEKKLREENTSHTSLEKGCVYASR